MELDPYWKWLGIPPEQQPPDHYVLLGIASFEANRDVIENAAIRQMSHVRTFQGGPHAAISQQLLNELSTVRLCLLDEEQKQVYDEQLQARLSATHSSQDLPVATQEIATGQLPVAQEVAEVYTPHQAPRRSRRRRQRRHAKASRLAWTVVLYVVLALLVCVSVGIFLYRLQTSDDSSDRESIRFHHLSLIDNRCLDNAC
ncbi:MAG: hypothetical protein VB817_11660 [Pirellulaceae bacterium]